jgi:uncharacterized membrane protein YjdF
MKKAKQKAIDTANQVKTIWKNFVELVEALSLLTVSLFSAHQAFYRYELDSIHTIILFGASIIILLIGAKYTINHFKKG